MNQLLDGRYQLVEVLGSNPLGQTLLVHDLQSPAHPECVIRHLRLPNDNPRTLRFVMSLLRKKAESLSKLNQRDRIPQILGCFEQGNSFYLVEEFIPGNSLDSELIPGQPWGDAAVIDFLQECLEILVMVHGWGLVHRSLKPSSLIRRQGDGQLILTGFGIFKDIGAQLMRSPGVSPAGSPSVAGGKALPKKPAVAQAVPTALHNGTSAYMSPEQPQRQTQFNTDLYSLGVIGLQAITGLTLLELSQTLHHHATHSPTPAWPVPEDTDPELIRILNRMVHPDSTQRYQLATEILDELRQLKKQSTVVQPLTTRFASRLGAMLSRDRRRAESPSDRPTRWRWGITALVAALGVAALFWAEVPQTLVSSYLLRQGDRLASQNQTEQAIRSYTEAIEASPNSTAHYNRGMTALQQGDSQAALEDLTAAIQLDPTLLEAYYQRGNVRFELGDRQGALADYTEAIRLNPNYAAAYVNRGSVRADAGDERSAIADYTQAIQLDPNLTAAYINRCLSRSNLNEHQGAIADCTQAINLQPNSVLAYQNRGLARRRLGDFSGAIKDLNIAIRLDPDDPDPYYNRGLTRSDLGDSAGAIADYSEAIQRNPEHVFAYYDRGLLRAEVGDSQGAIADFQQSATLCLNSGRMGCYQDAQYQITLLQKSPPQ
ncbi:MAG TPA: tetratricopeptide repeat protein [Chroococcidiopsis sp.]